MKMKEITQRSLPGIPMILATIAAIVLACAVGMAGLAAGQGGGQWLVVAILIIAASIFVCCGFYMVQPNQAAVLELFGKYVGTVKDNGLRWNNPFFSKRKVSLRVRNFESGKLKVNELDGSPIEIAAVIVWQVNDASEAVYNVDDYESFVHIQSESALPPSTS